MATTPAYQAAQNGFASDLASTNQSAQLNQSLNNPAITLCGAGANVNQPAVGRGFTWYNLDNGYDISQPFSITGTSMGRIMVPLNPVGNGADVVVNLYSDNGGNPNIAAGPLQTVTITRDIINQMTAPNGLTDSSTPPMAVSQYSGAYLSNGITNGPYPLPAGGTSAVSPLGGLAQSGDFMVMCGGKDNNTGLSIASVNTFPYQGLGTLGLPVPQAQMAVGLNFPAAAIVNESYLVVMGGRSGNAATGPLSAVSYIASWDNNTGTVGSWSAQASMPTASWLGGAAAWGNYVYYVQGDNGSTGVLNCPVYYANVNNGQITTWNTAAGIPSGTSITSPYVAAINGWLIVAGGIDNGNNSLSTVYAAKISPTDGSIGGWQTIASLPVANYAFSPGLNTAVMGDILSLVGGINVGTGSISTVQSITVTAEGPGDIWYKDAMTQAGGAIVGGFEIGNGVYDLFSIDLVGGTGIYNTQVSSVSFVPVPLQATLTASTTYHWVFRMVGGTSSDYVQIGLDNGNIGLYGTALQSGSRFGTSWSSLTGKAVAMWMQDSTMGVVGILRHTIEGATTLGSGNLTGTMTNRWMTFIYENTISNSNLAPLLPKGFLDVTMAPMVPLNKNPTFTTGVSNWTPTNATFAQSNAQVHGGFSFSGLLTPTGGFTQAYVTSEQIPIPTAGNWSRSALVQPWLLGSGYFYSPTGWSNFQLNVNWFTSSGGYISTSSSATVSLTANTWTLVFSYYKPPATAQFMTIIPTENGSPAATNTLYCSNVNMTTPPEYTPSVTSVSQMSYSGGLWPPIGVTQLV